MALLLISHAVNDWTAVQTFSPFPAFMRRREQFLTNPELLAIVKRFRWRPLFLSFYGQPGAQQDWGHAHGALFG